MRCKQVSEYLESQPASTVHIVYHAHCTDGAAGAYVLSQKFPHSKMHGWAYGKPVGLLTQELKAGDVVLIVDFSFPPESMKQVCETGVWVVLLDHHQSALEALRGFQHHRFDMTYSSTINSGVMLAWNWANADSGLKENPVPPLLYTLIQDRDLWLYKDRRTAAVSEYLSSKPPTPEAIGNALGENVEMMFMAGSLLRRKTITQVENLRNTAGRIVEMTDGKLVSFVNCPGFLASDTGDNPEVSMSVCWYIKRDDQVKASVRSNYFSVLPLAVKFGGGGHRQAAGITFENYTQFVEFREYVSRQDAASIGFTD